jgi:hypothetical protein
MLFQQVFFSDNYLPGVSFGKFFQTSTFLMSFFQRFSEDFAQILSPFFGATIVVGI